MIQTKRLSKSYADKAALRALDLEVGAYARGFPDLQSNG